MTERPTLLSWIAILSIAALGCSEPTTDGPVSFEMDRTTDNGVTTVRNLAGSTWGAPGTLLEEMSIGRPEGGPEEMFGQIAALWATDERLYVLDRQTPALREYDHDANYLGDVGASGQGPGEFLRPGAIAVLSDGTIAVQDNGNRRIVLYDADGATLHSWRPQRGFPQGMTALNDGTLAARFGENPGEGEPRGPMRYGFRGGYIRFRDGEAVGETVVPPGFGFVEQPILTILVDGVPSANAEAFFRPRHVWDVLPDGGVVAGISDRYRFEIHPADGDVTVVERYHEPVAVDPAEADYAVARVEGEMRRRDPAWVFDGDPPRSTKPAYRDLRVDRDGRIWVSREIASWRAEPCAEDPRDDPMGARARPCWVSPVVLDLFAPDGTYLGEVQPPPAGTLGATFARGDMYWAAVEGDDGLVSVKRFRLVTPEGT